MNHAQFGAVVTQYEKLVYSICYQFTRDHYTAEDLAQETFLSAYRHIDDCPAEYLKPWIAKIATNKAKDYLKSAYNRRVQTPGEDGLPETGAVLLPATPAPEEIALSREATAEVSQDILALKEPYHRVAVLFFLEERSVDEIATRLERPPKTVHTQLYRARQMLQKKLTQNAERRAM